LSSFDAKLVWHGEIFHSGNVVQVSWLHVKLQTKFVCFQCCNFNQVIHNCRLLNQTNLLAFTLLLLLLFNCYYNKQHHWLLVLGSQHCDIGLCAAAAVTGQDVTESRNISHLSPGDCGILVTQFSSPRCGRGFTVFVSCPDCLSAVRWGSWSS